jgi:hypothetical protein
MLGATGASPAQPAPYTMRGYSLLGWAGLGAVGRRSRTIHGQEPSHGVRSACEPPPCPAPRRGRRLGAHSVEHGYIMDAECIAELRAKGTWYVPTLAISHLPNQASDPWEKPRHKRGDRPAHASPTRIQSNGPPNGDRPRPCAGPG